MKGIFNGKFWSLLMFMLMFQLSGECQNIRFTYDEAGNRIRRETVQVEEVNELEKEMQKFLKGDRIDKNISITANKYTDSIHIDIKDENFAGPYNINIYDIAGYKMLGTNATTNIYDADISHLPDGIYIVVVTYQGKTNAWKIKYSK
ncbi:T9SS C-terminal target domain-containing protein [Muribaculaceae bacterium Isolate-113 (HZI)]|nr:T9SS C-terminal target domain-containing protein [Muribaculaceae bacterium Isolate-113 (HZI)]ROT24134.1 T9SS C-terminal target domain-containing protein [Muribaculaceae bacterium Isolate-114 (HZI)]